MATKWDDMLLKAVAFQQSIYDLIPDWKVYNRKSIPYIKQDVGYAIYGDPTVITNDDRNKIGVFQQNNYVNYGPTANAVIDKICAQILKHSNENDDITLGIIFNIIFYSKTPTKCNMKKDELIALPIFKVLRQKNIQNTEKVYTIYYIDTSARVYTNWEDYLLSNKLPMCTMVYPADGCYRPNPSFPITKEHSYVWLEAKESYECSSRADIISKVNTSVNILNTAASVTLGVSSLMTPASAVILPAIIISNMASVWTIGKCSADLIDRSTHGESISDPDALSAWLGIVTCAINIGSSISSTHLRNSVAYGETVSSCITSLHDASIVVNVSFNLLAFCTHSYNLYQKYKTNEFQTKDIVSFGCSLLFFANSIINMNFAKAIIENTQGNILHNFEVSLRNDNMVKRYEHVKNLAATNYPMNKIDQNAAVIRYINTVDCSIIPSLITSYIETWSENGITLTGGKLKLCGITLIDPMLFIADFMDSCINHANGINTNQSNDDWVTNNRTLIEVLQSALSDLYLSGDYQSDVYVTIVDFKTVIDSIKNFSFNQEEILHSIFNAAVALLKSQKRLTYLVETCCFLCNYIKKTFEEFRTSPYDTRMKYVKLVFDALREAVQLVGFRFLNAIKQYVQFTATRGIENSFL